MANQFLCGFDDYAAADLPKEWTSVPTSPTIVAGRTGSAMRCSGSQSARITIWPNGTVTVTVGFAFRSSALGGTLFFILHDATRTHVGLRLNVDGTLSVIRSGQGSISFSDAASTVLGTGATVLSVNTFYYIELKVTIGNDPAGAFELRLNGSGVAEIADPDCDTQNAGTALVSGLGFAVASGNTDVDDLYANDATGSANTGFEGDSQVDFHLPVTPAGAHSEWDRSAGADQWATIDDNPPNSGGADDYNSTAVLNELDTLNFENFKNDGATIAAVQLSLLTDKVGAGTCGIAAVLRESGADNVGTTHYPGGSVSYARQNYDSDHAGDPWTQASLDAEEWGYKKTA